MDPFVQVEVKRHGASGLRTEQRFESRWGLGERRGRLLPMPEAPPVTSADMPGVSSISPAQGGGGAAEELLRNRSGEGARRESGRSDWV